MYSKQQIKLDQIEEMFFSRAAKQESKIKAKIKELFKEINEEYLDEIVKYYNPSINELTRVARITEKLVEIGQYPTTASPRVVRNVRDSNEMLLLLMHLFPDAHAAFLRDYTAHGSISNMPFMVEKILKLNGAYEKRIAGTMIFENDLFRTVHYQNQVKQKLLNEFPFHWESTILAIMAESNFYYPDCYAKLKEIKASNLWTSIFPFTKRSWVDFTIDDDSLLREIQQMEREKLDAEAEKDKDIAVALNEQEHSNNGQFITCQCCFGETVFEELGQCEEGHLFCHDCISRALKIGLFDTGTLRGKSVKCMSSETECKAEIALDEVKRVCLASDNKNLFTQYQGTLWEAILKSSAGGLDSYAICPFCKYAEEKPRVSLWSKFLPYGLDIIQKYSPSATRILGLIIVFYITLYSPFMATVLVLVNNHIIQKHRDTIMLYLLKRVSIPSWLRRPSPQVLNCKNCSKATCTKCNDTWNTPHTCFEKQADSLRVYVENAKSNALIRVCPSCSIRFSKIDGCNKMTCPNCRYEMCYVCRRDIGTQKYDHFCKHFRIVPGSECSECRKCDLYQKERDEVAVARAAQKAEEEWKKMNPDDAQKLS